MTKLEEKIKQEIKATKPTEKWKIFGLLAVKDLVIIILWLISVLLIGIIINITFNFQQWQGLFWGRHFFAPGLLAFPYEMLLVLVLIILIQFYLLQKVHFIYRWPQFYVVLAIILSLVLGYFLAEKIGINRTLAHKPGINRIYRNEGRFLPRGNNMINGEVISISNNIYLIKDFSNQIKEVFINEQTDFLGDRDLKTGDNIKVVAKIQNNQIIALTICKIDPEMFGCRGIGKRQRFMNPPKMY